MISHVVYLSIDPNSIIIYSHKKNIYEGFKETRLTMIQIINCFASWKISSLLPMKFFL